MTTKVKTHKRKGRIVRHHTRKQGSVGFVPVQSSHVGRVQYDPESQTLTVGFKTNGSVYKYRGVSAQKFAAFKKAESAGTYLHKSIINRHKTEKVK